MKFIISSVCLLMSHSVFANIDSSNEKLKLAAQELQKIIQIDNENLSTTQLICGTMCKYEIVDKNGVLADVIFDSQKNQLNNATKVAIDITKRTNNECQTMTAIYLDNNEYEFFSQNEKYYSDYAFYNSEFVNKRNKRQIPQTLQWIGAGMIGAWVGDRFTQLNSDVRAAAQHMYNNAQRYSGNTYNPGGVLRSGGGMYR